jgi:glycosyltransferase involved in cell wall biosynthesis
LRIAEHDIGLALETPSVRSRDLTVTNKVFQYLEAGLAIVATETAGQREILSECSEAGVLVPAADPKAIAAALSSFINDPAKLRAAKAAALRASQERFSWGEQEAALIQSATLALGREAPAASVESSVK